MNNSSRMVTKATCALYSYTLPKNYCEYYLCWITVMNSCLRKLY